MSPDSIIVKSYAKINLFLKITGNLPNGYHSLYSIFQEIDLHDTLRFTPSTEFEFISNHAGLNSENNNLCVRAYREMKKYAPASSNFRIQLDKKIPLAAGLGGGSSNAASVIKFLNREWKIHFPNEKLISVAKDISADAPFFIEGKTQIAEGIGDILKPVKLPESFILLLVCPNIKISTPWAYSEIDLTMNKENFNFDPLFGNERIYWELFENQFESVVFPAYPEVGRVKEHLLDEGAIYAGLSGSGSTVFGVYKNRKEALRVSQCFNSFTTFITLPIF